MNNNQNKPNNQPKPVSQQVTPKQQDNWDLTVFITDQGAIEITFETDEDLEITEQSAQLTITGTTKAHSINVVTEQQDQLLAVDYQCLNCSCADCNCATTTSDTYCCPAGCLVTASSTTTVSASLQTPTTDAPKVTANDYYVCAGCGYTNDSETTDSLPKKPTQTPTKPTSTIVTLPKQEEILEQTLEVVTTKPKAQDQTDLEAIAQTTNVVCEVSKTTTTTVTDGYYHCLGCDYTNAPLVTQTLKEPVALKPTNAQDPTIVTLPGQTEILTQELQTVGKPTKTEQRSHASGVVLPTDDEVVAINSVITTKSLDKFAEEPVFVGLSEAEQKDITDHLLLDKNQMPKGPFYCCQIIYPNDELAAKLDQTTAQKDTVINEIELSEGLSFTYPTGKVNQPTNLTESQIDEKTVVFKTHSHLVDLVGKTKKEGLLNDGLASLEHLELVSNNPESWSFEENKNFVKKPTADLAAFSEADLQKENQTQPQLNDFDLPEDTVLFQKNKTNFDVKTVEQDLLHLNTKATCDLTTGSAVNLNPLSEKIAAGIATEPGQKQTQFSQNYVADELYNSFLNNDFTKQIDQEYLQYLTTKEQPTTPPVVSENEPSTPVSSKENSSTANATAQLADQQAKIMDVVAETSQNLETKIENLKAKLAAQHTAFTAQIDHITAQEQAKWDTKIDQNFLLFLTEIKKEKEKLLKRKEELEARLKKQNEYLT